MRIEYLAVDTLPSRSANVVYVMAMVDAFAGLGHEVSVRFPRSIGTTAGATLDDARAEHDVDASVAMGFSPRLEIRGRLGGSYFPSVALAARARRPELVVTQNPRIALVARSLGLPVVLDLHAILASARNVRAARRLARFPDDVGFAFNTRRLQELVEAEVGVHLRSTAVRPNGVRLARFPEPSVPRVSAARTDGFRVVHAGHAYPGRGVDVFFEVAARMPDATFVQVGGDDADLARLRARVARDRLANVAFVPFVPPRDLPRELVAADVLVMPYTADAVVSDGLTRTMDYASPMKMIDFMAAGRPIVASSFAGIAETLRDGRNALLVPPGSAEELERAIRRLRSEPELGERLAREARRDAEGLTWTARAQALLDLARASRARIRT